MSIILRPLVNEKSMGLVKSDMYTFEVGKEATKKQIEKMIHDKFSVDVLSVKTINLQAKRKMQRSRKGYFYVAGFKKAIIKVKKGQKIALFEQAVTSEKEVEVRTGDGESLGTVKEKRSLLKGTKVRIESSGKSSESRKTDDKEQEEIKTDAKRPTKVSQKEAKKG